MDFNVLEFGAKGDGKTNDAPSIQKAINTCSEAGGGRVLLPAGRTYYSGSLVLKSFVDFCVEIGAILKASIETADYLETIVPEGVIGSYGGRPERAFLYAKDAPYVTISGRGRRNRTAQPHGSKRRQRLNRET